MEKWIRYLNKTGHYLIYLKARVKQDRLTVNAGYMAYITLLSLVPLTTVLFSALASFPAFKGVGLEIQNFIFSNFVPTAGEAIQSSLESFVANTSKMTTVGAAFLFVTALLLISTIDNNLNYIWRVTQKRRLVYSFSLYWMVLSLGPIFIGASIAITSYVASLKIIDDATVSGLVRYLPSMLSFVVFVGLYQLVPNTKVRISHSLIGALIASALFEISKSGFAYYIETFPTYHLIYGALASVPILFMWIYLCWIIVLIGAEITAGLGEKELWDTDDNLFSAFKQRFSKGESTSDSSDSESE